MDDEILNYADFEEAAHPLILQAWSNNFPSEEWLLKSLQNGGPQKMLNCALKIVQKDIQFNKENLFDSSYDYIRGINIYDLKPLKILRESVTVKTLPSSITTVKILPLNKNDLFYEFHHEISKQDFVFKSEASQFREFLKANPHVVHIYCNLVGNDFHIDSPLQTLVWKTPRDTTVIYLTEQASQHLVHVACDSRTHICVKNGSVLKFPELKFFSLEQQVEFDLLKMIMESSKQLKYLQVPWIGYSRKAAPGIHQFRVNCGSLTTLLIEDGYWIIEGAALDSIVELGIDHSAHVQLGYRDRDQESTMKALEKVHLRAMPEVLGWSDRVWPNVTCLRIQHVIPTDISLVLGWIDLAKLSVLQVSVDVSSRKRKYIKLNPPEKRLDMVSELSQANRYGLSCLIKHMIPSHIQDTMTLQLHKWSEDGWKGLNRKILT